MGVTQTSDDADDADDVLHTPFSAEGVVAGADRAAYCLVNDPAGLETVRAALEETAFVGLDVETTGLNPRKDRVRLLSLSTDTVEGGMIVYVVDVAAVNLSALWEALAERPVVAHNAVFDLQFLTGLGFAPGVAHDTMLMSQLLHGTRKPKSFHGLQQTADREMGKLLDKTEQRSDWSGELTAEQLRYAAEDAAVLPPLFADLTAKLKTAGLSRVAEIESRCLPAMAWLSRSGVPFDRASWEASPPRPNGTRKNWRRSWPQPPRRWKVLCWAARGGTGTRRSRSRKSSPPSASNWSPPIMTHWRPWITRWPRWSGSTAGSASWPRPMDPSG